MILVKEGINDTAFYQVDVFLLQVESQELKLRKLRSLRGQPTANKNQPHQVWSPTRFYSVRFVLSRILVKSEGFFTNTHSRCVSVV